jgi:outer membrane protein
MKKLVLSITMLVAVIFAANAQKYAFVDTEYILGNIPAYKAAQEQLDKISKAWQTEVDQKYQEIDKLYQNYQAEKVLLTEEMRQKREEEIVSKEREVKQLQNKYFGKDGELSQKRQELVKPIQDEIYQAVKELATEGNYAVIFDTASGMSMLYTNPKYDISDEVLLKLGYKN